MTDLTILEVGDTFVTTVDAVEQTRVIVAKFADDEGIVYGVAYQPVEA